MQAQMHMSAAISATGKPGLMCRSKQTIRRYAKTCQFKGPIELIPDTNALGRLCETESAGRQMTRWPSSSDVASPRHVPFRGKTEACDVMQRDMTTSRVATAGLRTPVTCICFALGSPSTEHLNGTLHAACAAVQHSCKHKLLRKAGL